MSLLLDLSNWHYWENRALVNSCSTVAENLLPKQLFNGLTPARVCFTCYLLCQLDTCRLTTTQPIGKRWTTLLILNCSAVYGTSCSRGGHGPRRLRFKISFSMRIGNGRFFAEFFGQLPERSSDIWLSGIDSTNIFLIHHQWVFIYSMTPKVKVGYALTSVAQTTTMTSAKLAQLLSLREKFCFKFCLNHDDDVSEYPT